MKKTIPILKYKAKKVCAKTALLLLPLLVFLSGCAAFDAPLEGMLSPPKLTKTQTEIYNALTLSIGEQSELIYPKSGEFRSPFVLFNMDGEPTDEAAVFYREKSPDPDTVSGLRMNLLDLMDGQWVSVADKALSGADIERISFYDFGGGINMMISCSFLGQSETALSVMTYSDSYLEELYKTTYSYMDRYDVNDDGFEELFLVHYDPALETNVAYLVGQSKKEEEENRFGLLSSAELASDMASVQRLTRQKIKEGYFLLYIDYSKGDNVYGTQLLSCYSDNLLSISLDKDTSRRYNSNIPMLYSTDIDGDGRVEIPVTSPMLGYEGLTVPEQMLEVDWLVINEESVLTASPKYRTYISTGYEYIFYIPVRWQDFVTVQKTENNTVNFTLYDMNTFADVVLSVRATDEPPEEEGWEHYGDSDSKVYIKTPAADAPMALTPDELNSSLYIVPRRSESR
ncbi:MAG: hypothetical protein K2J79_03395 [Ruminiclostridium sp.]|nr:hypothetical protein [Ruminiclostridium sp.]